MRRGITLPVVSDPTGNQYFIWVNERLIKIAFKGFVNKEQVGWGVVDGFTSDNLRIWLAGAEFKAYKFPLKVEKKFLELYKKGFFKT